MLSTGDMKCCVAIVSITLNTGSNTTLLTHITAQLPPSCWNTLNRIWIIQYNILYIKYIIYNIKNRIKFFITIKLSINIKVKKDATFIFIRQQIF